MSFASEFEMENRFIEYLKNNNYPKESIAVEYNIGERCRVDIAIIDPHKNIPVQLFEIKNRKNNETIHAGIEQLKRYRSFLKDRNIPTYLVFPKDVEPYFEIINIDDNDFKMNKNANEYQNTKIIFNYNAQLNARINENVDIIKNEEKKVIDKFKIKCWVISTVILIIGIFSKIGFFTIEAKDISLMGIAVAFFLIPYAGKLKILGVEFERLKKDKNQK